VSSNPQELCGVEGNSNDKAWQITTGRPTTVIAVLDSGIEWCEPNLVNKIALNRNALPPPENAAGLTKAQLEHNGQTFTDNDPYDLTDSGLLDVSQYANDPRVAAVVATYGGYFCASQGTSYTGITAADLIRAFGDPKLGNGKPNTDYVESTGPKGFSNAIAGWNFLDNNNNPFDDVQYGHGTGEGQDIAGSANSTAGEVGACPDCMIMPVRVGTSFITTGDPFGEAVLFAVDSGATMISEALGITDVTPTDRQAVAYAAANGVPIVGSAADEESEHQNLPSALPGIINVNSTTQRTNWTPASSLYLNGCTNFGPDIAVTVESGSCSSEATGKTSGTVGLLESAAADAVGSGKLKDYPGLRSVTGNPVPLSANEVMQLVTMSADDVNFATAAPNATPPAPADNYAVTAPDVPFATTTMYPTTPGFDIYTGWGRLDAARIVQWVRQGRIPPEAAITSPQPFVTYTPSGALEVKGMVGAVRSKSYRYQVDVGIGAAPATGSWRLVGEGSGHGSRTGVLATLSLPALAKLFAADHLSLQGGAVTASGMPNADRFTFTVRVVVEDASGLIGVAQAADFLHEDSALLPGFPKAFASSLDSPPRLAPIGPGGEDALLVPEADGTIHALLPNGTELPGWPVHTRLGFVHANEAAYATHAVTALPRGEIVGGIAVGDLADSSGHSLDVVGTDALGNVYAWGPNGKLLPGWPVHTNRNFSLPRARNPNNRLLPGIVSAPALADLQHNGTLDVVASSLDRHVYAFEPNGAAAPGWPVLVVDPSEVQSVDPTTNQITFLPTANPDEGTEIVDTPAIGRLGGGTGPPDVVVGADEEYAGTAYANLGLLGTLIGGSLNESNSRVYAIEPNGSLHAAAPGAPKPPGMPDPGAFLPGWPAHIADLDANLLPTIGDGVTGTPALADLKGTGQLDVVTSSTAGPVYELRPNGSSLLGRTGGLPNVAAFVPQGQNVLGDLLGASLPSLGSPSVGVLGKPGGPLTIADPGASIGRLLDELEPASQTPNNNQVDTWSAKTGHMNAGGPHLMSDLQFQSSPLIANVGGSGSALVETSGLYDVRAYGANGREVAGWPKFTGGWMLYEPVVGPWAALSNQVLATGTRSGMLFVWSLPTAACASSGSWPQSHHDLWNTSNVSEHGAAAAVCKPAG
jgi:hypothetical protein